MHALISLPRPSPPPAARWQRIHFRMIGQFGKANGHIDHTPLDALTASYEIGDLYDARHRRFLHAGKLFQTEEILERDQASSYKYVKTNNISERIDKLGVSARVKLDLLLGKIDLASASYTKTDKQYAARHTMHVVLNGKTGTKKVDPSVYSLPEKDLLLKDTCATHVITEVRRFNIVVRTIETSAIILCGANLFLCAAVSHTFGGRYCPNCTEYFFIFFPAGPKQWRRRHGDIQYRIVRFGENCQRRSTQAPDQRCR